MIPRRILIIQTAFIGDVILSTGLVETLKAEYPEAEIDFLLRKGNEQLFENNPNVSNLLVWDKKNGKLKNLWGIISKVRSKGYDLLVNQQRYLSSGIIAAFSLAKYKVGFSQNPLSFLYDEKVNHSMASGQHDIERNHKLIESFTDKNASKPKLYPSPQQYDAVLKYKSGKYITIAPASVWFTKQFPKEKWVEFLDLLDFQGKVYFVGAPGDSTLSDEISAATRFTDCENLCGKMSLLESAALMKDATMNYVNDSAPQHICSALDAPVTAIFCSTIPEFGFGPLSSNSKVVQINEKLDCRPCGKHGHRQCPEGHFDCGMKVDVREMGF